MSFGLKNVGATYQRLMDKVLVNQLGRNVEAYVDDMVVKSMSLDRHLDDLRELFETIGKYQLKLNPEKCSFGVQAGKFLGFLLTHRGIEANPEKCTAIINMRSPSTAKEVQQLTGRMASLSRFLSKSADKALPIFQCLRKNNRFAWTNECEEAFTELKKSLASPPILTKPRLNLPLLIYISASDRAVSAILIQEQEGTQVPVYFVSRVLQGAEPRYQKIEKLALAILVTARKLRHYFQSYEVIVRMDHPIRQVLQKPDLAGRMMKWSIELLEYSIKYEPRGAIKAQALANFVMELTSPADEGEIGETQWILSVDGALNLGGSGAGIVLEGPGGILLEQSLRFEFRASNNQAEYKALLAGMVLAKEMGATSLSARSDSQLITGQVAGTFQAKDPQLAKYLEKVKLLSDNFREFTLNHVPREQNSRADLLSKLASTKKPVAVDYFSKWIEAEPIATISAEKVRAFLWKNVVCRYGVPQVLVSDNGTQFASARVRDFCRQIGIRTTFTSVEHPQSNGQAESANKVILSGLKKRVQDSGASWVEELPRVLWSYHTTVHSSTQDTPFNLVYGTDAMIPIEIAEPSVRTTAFSEEESD
ncbi:uncharacterized protein LOC109811062 [Cajanus cajan]|uniref:uncharacterized protein LOC109811062 n=1 Tax=Cajanus cajan TaxID=3821 RepID=UPI00098DBD70|nr:uncharacterized protein LOC109811062 [Cajanus cajan]